MTNKEISDDLNYIIDQYPDCSLNLETFASYWTGEISDSTIIQYIRYLQDLDVEIEGEELIYRIRNYETRDLEEYLNLVSDRVGRDRVKRERCKYFSYLALKKYLKALRRKDLIPDKPQGLSNPDSERQTFELSKDKIERIRGVIDSDMDDLAVVLMFYSGLRSYELLNITAEWIDFEAGEDEPDIRIPPEYAKGKGSNPNPEYAFLVPRFKQQLKQYIMDFYEWEGSYEELYSELVDGEDLEFKPLFHYQKDDEAKPDEKSENILMRERWHLTQMVKSYAQEAGLNRWQEVTPHVLRRSFINHTYNQLEDLSITSDLARHQDPQMTDDYYLSRNQEERKKAYGEAYEE
ncbi:MAG: tyrosine-type recombinase/integrase [Candidatus Nanohaloarchaea archaeon]